MFAFLVSTITSTAGLSGAFLILPFQVSILGFLTPGVTPTNLLFNVFGIPSGVYRFYRERRMVWPLVWTISLGTIPGLILGIYIRIRFMPDPAVFKLFVGMVLGGIALRLLYSAYREKKTPETGPNNNHFQVEPLNFNFKEISYNFNGQDYRVSTIIVFTLSLIVGTIGGIYGIGGGAILAPFLVAVFGLPVHTIAGAALCSTLVSSVFGVVFYVFLGPLFSGSGQSASPDWLLGLMFGIGGAAGIYTGARLQKFLPARLIKIILSALMLFIAIQYISKYFIE